MPRLKNPIKNIFRILIKKRVYMALTAQCEITLHNNTNQNNYTMIHVDGLINYTITHFYGLINAR